MRYLYSMAISMSRSQQPVSAAMAGLVLLSHQQEAGALPDSLQVIKNHWIPLEMLSC